MDEITRIRVFEPIDTNSLSLVSSSSSTNLSGAKSNSNSFMSGVSKPTTPIVASNDENNGLLQWQVERKEFVFKSNSTPSKKKRNLNGTSDQHLLHSRKRRSQLIGAKPRIQSKLYQATSKLDLLEVDKITSLPIAPPCLSQSDDTFNKSIDMNNDSLSNVFNKRSRLNPVEELRIHNNEGTRYVSYGILSDNSRQAEEDHPIVLVEDYIPYVESNIYSAKKRVSISDLRSKLNHRTDNHIPLKLKTLMKPLEEETPTMTLVPHLINEPNDNQDANGSFGIQNMVHNLLNVKSTFNDNCGDKYISNLKVKKSVKRCVVCERPLYELSSLVLNKEDYKEIVCQNCTHKYEQAAKIFENCEFETSIEDSNSSLMSEMDSPIEQYNPPQHLVMSKGGSDKFSNELIERLKLQLNECKQSPKRSHTGSFIKRTTKNSSLTWFLDAREKIKEKWLTNGLLPFFFDGSNTNGTEVN